MTIHIERTMALVVTEAGRIAAVSAVEGGLSLRLSHIAVGDGEVAPTEATTALANERIRREILSWAKPAPATIEVQTLIISSEPSWLAREIGVYAGDVLVAVGYRPSGLVDVTNGIAYAFSGSLSLVGLPPDVTIVVDAELTLDLLFAEPLVAMARAIIVLQRIALDQEIRIRRLEGKDTAGLTRFGG